MKAYCYTYCLLIGLLFLATSVNGQNVNWDNQSNLELTTVLHSEGLYYCVEQSGSTGDVIGNRLSSHPANFNSYPDTRLLYYREQSFALSQKSYRTLNGFFSYLKI